MTTPDDPETAPESEAVAVYRRLRRVSGDPSMRSSDARHLRLGIPTQNRGEDLGSHDA